MAAPILRYFVSEHLQPQQRLIAREFEKVAMAIDHALPPGPETSVALRKLLEAKDAAVRSSLDLQPVSGNAASPE